ncbi:MAG TPA: glutamate synthase central domain-containing protein, partial [Chloroflexia bacterium]|nr:glutamate synthase central domain-containing protein [Chloroflexia bacterium]
MPEVSDRSAQGLYDARFEHDACGIGFVARLAGQPGHDILDLALTAVANMAHRGGVQADGKSGDGAGVLTALPQAFFARELARREIRYPVADLAVGMVFLPRDAGARQMARRLLGQGLAAYGLAVLCWREVPIDPAALGARAHETCPAIEQALIGRPPGRYGPGESYERALYLARKTAEALARKAGIADFAIPSLSSRTLVYKGLLVAPLLGQFYPDLRDSLYATPLAVYHQRYSTNTFPTWERAQPFRMLSHNGEINTLRGNVTWMRAREAAWRRQAERTWAGGPGSEIPSGPALATQVAQLGPVVDESGSDSAMLDNVLELIVQGGRDVRHALALLVPEAWEHVPDLDPAWRAFYQYHAGLMEPWDGPAALAFSDGQVVGLALDRNGLRPARYLLTDDGLVVCGSEVGAVPIDAARIIRKGKVGPGQMIAADLRTGRFEENAAIKCRLAAQQPYAAWIDHYRHFPAAAPGREAAPRPEAPAPPLPVLQRAFGYTAEELTLVLRPMAEDGQEPIGSMGDDTPPAVFAERARPLYNYFKQRFAEVTNPPIDPLREGLVMSLSIGLGARGDLLAEAPDHAHLIWLASPVLTAPQLAALCATADPAFASAI